MPILKEVIQTLEKLAPPCLAEEWDNVGLMVGDENQLIHKVLCALDVNEAVVEEAIKCGAQCIITHHPFLFSPLKQINLQTPKGKLINKLIKADLAVYSMHTNYDIAPGGLNDFLCEQLGIEAPEILEVTGEKQLCKIAVYVPEEAFEKVRETVVAENKCTIGNYKGCTFSGQGEGTFMPLEGSQPYVGTEAVLEKVVERKLEFIAYEEQVTKLLQVIEAVHPYEEVAFDVYTLNNISQKVGLGRYGLLKEKLTLEDFIAHLKQVFKVPYVRVTNLQQKEIQKVAICSGSGSSYLKRASQVADVYITGDMQFHKGQEAQDLGLSVIDVGHYASENIAMRHIADYVKKHLKTLEVICSEVDGETLIIK